MLLKLCSDHGFINGCHIIFGLLYSLGKSQKERTASLSGQKRMAPAFYTTQTSNRHVPWLIFCYVGQQGNSQRYAGKLTHIFSLMLCSKPFPPAQGMLGLASNAESNAA